jgi:hypothetical protein
MIHHNFELLNCKSFEEFKLNLDNSKKNISKNNGEVTFLEIEYLSQKNFNEYCGDYYKYNVLKDYTIIGILNVFYDKKKGYINIFTNPIN